MNWHRLKPSLKVNFSLIMYDLQDLYKRRHERKLRGGNCHTKSISVFCHTTSEGSRDPCCIMCNGHMTKCVRYVFAAL